jgi:hypothetical protein
MMRSLVSSLLLVTFVPAIARAQAMVEVPTPSDRPPPVAATPPVPPAPPADPQAEWDHHFLSFEDWVAYNVHTGAIVNAWSKPVEGKYRRPLAYGEFYERVGRGDLADRYRTRRNVKIGLGVVGALAMLGGFIAIGVQFKANSDAFDGCVDNHVFGNISAGNCSLNGGNDGYIAGGVLLGAGFIGILAAIITPVQPAQPYEARELADQYNQKLRNQLGLDRPAPAPPASTPEPTTAPATTPTTFTLAPSVDPKGAGLRLAVRF